jgi:hypothetical protein
MIPYPHDTTDILESTEPVIGRSAFLDGRELTPRRGFVFGAFLVAMCVHGYALAVLPDVMEIDLEQVTTVEPGLMNEEIGNDPDLPTNYNVDRIEEVGVPGPLNVEAIGQVPDDPDRLPH